MTATKTKGELTTARILEAAAQCIATLGIEKTSISRIAERAEVSRGLVAHYFSEKDRLFMAVVEYIARQAHDHLGATDPGWSPAQRLSFVLNRNLEFFITRPHYLSCFLLFYYYATFKREFRALNSRLRQGGIARIREALQELAPGRRAGPVAEALHRELTAGVQGFRIFKETRDPIAYQGAVIRSLEDRVRDLMDDPRWRLPPAPSVNSRRV